MTKSIARQIDQNRPPRVQLQYEIELYGAKKTIQLPFVIGVFAWLSGKPAEPLPPVDDRRFLEYDAGTFDRCLAAIKPRVAFQVPNTMTSEGKLTVELTFECMDDFHPGTIARRLVPLQALLDTRDRLVTLSTRAEEGSDAEALTAEDVEALILKAFNVVSDDLRDPVLAELSVFVTHGLADPNVIAERPVASAIAATIRRIDDQLSSQMNEIVHHSDFRELEAAWRGLHHLVCGPETNELLKIRVFNISKSELAKILKRFKGTAWDQSPIFKQVVEAEFGRSGGEPFGCLLGDYYLDHSPADIELVQGMAHIAAAAHAPFIAGASPMMFGMESWQELGNPRNLTRIHAMSEYAPWRAIRESDDARYVGLTLPRYLARLPYGARSNPVEEFSFEEDTSLADHSNYTWANSVYAWGVNVTRAFKLYGWCARIHGVETGGIVEDLPVHTFLADEGDLMMKCPTEIAITDRRAAELEQMGFLALVHRKYSSFAAFTNSRSVQKPIESDDPAATADASLMATLSYTLAAGRFAHYVHCIVRDTMGSEADPRVVRDLLRDWLAMYVDDDPVHSPEWVKARRPLASGDVVVEEIAGQPPFYSLKVFVRPYHQLEPLTRSMGLVARLPVPTMVR